MGLLARLKRRIVNWLLRDVVIDELKVRRIRDVGNTGYFNSIVLDALTSDPSLVAGKVWYRSDLGELRFTDGVIPRPILDLARRGPWWFCNHWIDGAFYKEVTGSASVSVPSDGMLVILSTGTTAFSRATIQKDAYGLGNPGSWDAPRYLGIYLWFGSDTGQIIWLVTGGVSDYAGVENTKPHFGFFVYDNKLYGSVSDGTSNAMTGYTTISALGRYLLEAFFYPGDRVEFYVNRSLLGTLTTCLPPPDATYGSILMNASIYNREAANKWIDIFVWACG